MKVYQKSVSDIEKELNTSSETGLTNAQVSAKQAEFGLNELAQKKKESLLVKFLKEFTDPLIIILLIAAVVSVLVDPSEWTESVIILIVVLLNAILGVYQENNAEKSLEALKNMASPNAKVIREGQKLSIPSKDVCVGDILVIEAGDVIASDARISKNYHVQVDESALTGESLSVDKTDEVISDSECPLGDQKNMIFASTMCTSGRCEAIVTSVGMQNEVGKIASMLQEDNNQVTPLQMKLAQISKVIGMMCLVICLVVFGVEMMSGLSWIEAFKTAVALAVAAIPEGLATVVTIVLSIGVTKMVKHNAIVRKLPSVETLGSCNVICSDKTGTLTQNKMTVTKTYTPDSGYRVFNKDAASDVVNVLNSFTLCSDGTIVHNEDGTMTSIGDPTETAVVYASELSGYKKADLMHNYPRINEIAFDSDRKMMSVFLQTENEILQVTKGAPDVILSRCTNDISEFNRYNEEMSNDALRVLAVAIRHHKVLPHELLSDEMERDMTCIGLIGMIDPPREEVKEAIQQAKSGGIKTVMITGDHLTTAKAIAKDLGILSENDLAITGEELNQMSQAELEQKIDQIRVYARVAPEHKVRVVKAFQAKGEVVAMTGDGVNDSPALKTADIGCAMGITGTDVSKNASDMILTDDNFSTIIEAVRQGRGIYANIMKDVHFLLASNIGEVITIFFASLIDAFTSLTLGVPLMPMHLLWVNLITDTLPAFALGMEPVEDNVMDQKPRKKDESFFANGLGFKIAYQGLLVGALTLISYMYGNQDSHEIGMTMAFITLVLTQLIHSFNVKSSKSVFNKQVFNNKYLWYSLIIGVVLQATIIYVPFLSDIFNLAPLDPIHFGVAIGLSFVILIVMEVIKLCRRLMK